MVGTDLRRRVSAITSTRRTARIAGVFFLLTFITSIPAAFYFCEPVLTHADYVASAGADTRVAWGAVLEVFLAITGIGTAVTLYPVLRRQSEGIAIGYVAARVVESTLIVVGIVSLMSVVTLRQGAAGADSASLLVAGRSLVAVHDWTFLLGPGLVAGFANGLMLGYLLYRSRLVPRAMALLGVIGGPLIFVSGIAVLLGAYPQISTVSAIATIPEFLWELSLGLYLVVKGFRPSALTVETQPRQPETPAPAVL